MTERIRIPMPSKPPEMFGEFDVAAAMTPTTRYARRFTMDVSEDALANMGREAMPFIAKEVAERAIREHAHVIQGAVADYLNNPAWAAPIIEDEIRKTVARYMTQMLDDIYAETRAQPNTQHLKDSEENGR